MRSITSTAPISQSRPPSSTELGINAAVMGLVLGAFFWTYASMQMPFGWIADRIGARIASATPLSGGLCPPSSRPRHMASGSLTGYRLLLGVGEAGAYPSVRQGRPSNWFPEK